MRRIYLAGLVGAACAALASTWLIAQPVTQNAVSGFECWNAGQGPGGPSAGFLCINPVSGRNPVVILTAVTGNFTVGAVVTSPNFTMPTGGNMGLVAQGGDVVVTAQPSASTWTLPASPVVDGAIVGFCNGTNAAFVTNAVTVAANTNQTLVPTAANITLTTLAAQSCFRYQWSQINTSWYRVQ